MRYTKDSIRTFFKKLLKIDRQFLNRLIVLDNFDFEYLNETYKIKLYETPVYLRNLTSDFDVFEQVIMNLEYSFITDLHTHYFKKAPTVAIDAGANIGLTSIYLSKKFPKLKIHAYEVETENYLALNRNIMNWPNIVPHNLAIWNNKNGISIDSSFRDGRSWSFQASEKSGPNLIQSTTVAYEFERLNIEFLDILKMDIEGAEKQVILEDESINSVLKKVKIICLEIHDEIVSRIEITNKIRGFGFLIFGKGETIFCVNKKHASIRDNSSI